MIFEMFASGSTTGTIAKHIHRPTPTITRFVQRNQLVRGHAQNTRSSLIVVDGKGRCTQCEDWQELKFFPFTGVRHYVHSVCKKCKIENDRNRVKSSPDLYVGSQMRTWRHRSKEIGVPFDLTKEYVLRLMEVQGGKCFYSNEPLQWMGENKREAASLDRVIPSHGYVVGNVVLCSVRMNSVKSDLTLEEMRAWMPAWYEKLCSTNWLTIVNGRKESNSFPDEGKCLIS